MKTAHFAAVACPGCRGPLFPKEGGFWVCENWRCVLIVDSRVNELWARTLPLAEYVRKTRYTIEGKPYRFVRSRVDPTARSLPPAPKICARLSTGAIAIFKPG